MDFGLMERPLRTPSPPPTPSPSHEMRSSHSPGNHPTPGLLHPPAPASPPSPGQQNLVTNVVLGGVPIVCLHMDGKERLCLAQISNTLLKEYSYNEIHNRRVALGITCVQCTPVQLEILRRAGAMPVSSRRCGMITKREAERLVKSFLEDHSPPQLPENFAFNVAHTCGWGCKGQFIPSRYNSSRAKCIKCVYCAMFFSPNKFIFHFHRTPDAKYRHPDAANFNSWRRHLDLDYGSKNDDLVHAWEDVKAMFNGGSRKRVLSGSGESPKHDQHDSERETPTYQSPKRQRIPQDDIPTSTPSSQSHAPFSFPPGPFINNPTNPNPGPFFPPTAHHPAAFNFFGGHSGHGGHGGHSGAHATGQELVAAGGVDKMNFTDIWKAKPPAAAAYCHPFNLLWAKNLANMDPGLNPFRDVLDPEMLARSRDHSDVTKGSVCGDKTNRFSAFKPVGLFGNESGGYGAHISEVVSHVVSSPPISMTPSPPLSDDVEPDIDVTESAEEMAGNARKPNDHPATTTTTFTPEATATTLTRTDSETQQRTSATATTTTTATSNNSSDNALNNNNNDKADDTDKSAVTSSCPGHVTKGVNAKNFSVEFLANTESNKVEDRPEPPVVAPTKVEAPEANSPEGPALDVDLTSIYKMSKEQLQSELIEILAKRDRLEKSVQFMKEAKSQNQTDVGS